MSDMPDFPIEHLDSIERAIFVITVSRPVLQQTSIILLLNNKQMWTDVFTAQYPFALLCTAQEQHFKYFSDTELM